MSRDPNRIAVELAAARLAEAEARALEAHARRAEMCLLADFERDRAAEARATVLRLEREQTAAVKLWMAEQLGAASPC